MQNEAIRPRKGLQLRKIGRQYMIVEASADNVNMSNVYSMNATAARLWQLVGEQSHTLDSLAQWLCDNYEVDHATACSDVEKLLADWRSFGLID